jgi:hypothetical protein
VWAGVVGLDSGVSGSRWRSSPGESGRVRGSGGWRLLFHVDEGAGEVPGCAEAWTVWGVVGSAV